MRVFACAVLATVLFASNALAGGAPALAPGKPAGVKDAQMVDNSVVIAAGLGLVAAGIAVAASASNNHTPTAVSTSTTAP